MLHHTRRRRSVVVGSGMMMLAGLTGVAAIGGASIAARQSSALDGPNPQAVQAFQRGEAALSARQYQLALEVFSAANHLLDGTSATAFYGMCRAQHGLGAFKKAADACADGVKYVGTDQRLRSALHFQRGGSLSALAQKPGDRALVAAEAEFRAVVAIAEAPPMAWFNLGVVLLKQSRDRDGVEALQTYLTRIPPGPDAETAMRLIAKPRLARERMAPDFRITTLHGDALRLQDQLGKVVLLDFWGTWCPPCRDVVPDLVSLHERRGHEPFVMIGISSDPPGDEGKLRDFVSMNRMKWPQFHDRQSEVIHQYAVDAYPTYIVIDGDGVQRGRFEGRSSVKHVDTEIRKWLAELPKPPPR